MLSNQEIQQILSIIPKNQLCQTSIKDLSLQHSDHPFTLINHLQEPSICLVLQGEREVTIGEKHYLFDNTSVSFCPVNLPMNIKVSKASVQKPYLFMSIKLDLELISKVKNDISITNTIQKHKKNIDNNWNWKLNDTFYSALKRLLLLLYTPNDINFLSPLIYQEIYYRLLLSEYGSQLNALINNNSKKRRIYQATHWIKQNLSERLNIDSLANQFGMSSSSFYQHFKEITQLSPLQYQKSLRLNKAKNLIQLQNGNISEIAYQVGYQSPSQFSRDYHIYFGYPPTKENS